MTILPLQHPEVDRWMAWQRSPGRLARTCGARVSSVRASAESGMSTAEYAVGTIAAVAFAAVLYKVVSSPAVLSALTAIINRALKAPF